MSTLVTQVGAEFVVTLAPQARVTQVGAEFIATMDPHTRVTQVGAEFAAFVYNTARVTQVGVEFVYLDGSGGVPLAGDTIRPNSGAEVLFLAEITAYDSSLGQTRVLRYANGRGYVTSAYTSPASTWYDARIAQPVDVSRSIFSDGSTQGATNIAIGDLQLLNGDGLLDDLLTYSLDGRFIRILRSTAPSPQYPNDFQTVFVGTMDVPEFTDTLVTIKLRDGLMGLTLPFQTTKYAGDNVLPNGLEGVAGDLKGKPKPVCYGIVTGIAPPCVNTTKLIYQVSDGAVQNIDAVYDRGLTLTPGATYPTLTDLLDDAQAPAAGTFRAYLDGGYVRLGASPAGTPTMDVTEGATSANRTAAQLYVRALTRANLSNPNTDPLGTATRVTKSGATRVTRAAATRVTYASVSNRDLVALDIANPAQLGFWSGTEEIAIIDVIDQITMSVGAWWGVSRAGVFRIAQFTAPTGTPVLSITPNDLLKPLTIVPPNDPGKGLPVYRVTVNWGQNYTTQTTDLAAAVSEARRSVVGQQWRAAVASDTDIQMVSLLSPETVEDSLLVTEADAKVEAARRLALRKVRRFRFEIVLPMVNEFSTVDIGDVIALSSPRFGLFAQGSTSGVLFRVLGVAPNARDRSLTLTIWGRAFSIFNRVTTTGALRVTKTGALRVTTPL